MSLSQFFRKAFSNQGFTELRLQSGERIRLSGEQPSVGATVMRVATNGEPNGTLANGTYYTANGYRLDVANGRAVSVMPHAAQPISQPTSQATSTNAPTNPLPEQDAKLAEQVSELAHQLDAAKAQLEAQVAAWQAGPASEPLAQTRTTERVAPNVNTKTSFSAGTLDPETLRESIWMIRQAKSGNPDFTFNARNTKRYAAELDSLTPIVPALAEELFYQVVVEEGLSQSFNVVNVPAKGSETYTLRVPQLVDDETNFLRPGIQCSYSDTGTLVINEINVNVRPWHYYREYCPKEWSAYLTTRQYVNDETLPLEAVVLEHLFSSIQAAWEQTLLTGQMASAAGFDGIFTLMDLDADKAAQTHAADMAATNLVTEFEKVYALATPELYQLANREPLIWMMPYQHLDAYLAAYREQYKELPRQNEQGEYLNDSAGLQAVIRPTGYLTDRSVITSRQNLLLGIGDDMKMDVRFHDAGKESYLFIRVEGHTGVNYADITHTLHISEA